MKTDGAYENAMLTANYLGLSLGTRLVRISKASPVMD